ncbi:MULTISPECIES: hypothetical protein [unclassified Bradyrhizobium]|uniref:hypothetical protein n=1 Tax=unclassified Bradyrhizobium TaxID=2631580 RepID=UPI002FF09454
MTDPTRTPSTKASNSSPAENEEMEEYAGGTIESRHGYIPIWLLVVYAVLFIWALYYLVVYWGGLGPGRI